MVNECNVPNCRNSTRGHPFPSDPHLREKWVNVIQTLYDEKTGKLWQPNKHSLVCEKHFLPEDFNITDKRERRRLRYDAVPSQFDFEVCESLNTCTKRSKSKEKADVKPEDMSHEDTKRQRRTQGVEAKPESLTADTATLAVS